MFESQITTLETVEPSVSDIALQLMIAALLGGQAMGVSDAYCYAEHFVAKRDKRQPSALVSPCNEWHPYPDVWPQSELPVLVKYDDWRYGVESAVFSSGVWLFKSLRPVVQWQEIKE